MNLSTAQAARRAKEVGIRKVLGSLKGQMVRQFLSEAMLYTGIATLIALILVYALMTPFNQVAGKSLAFQSIFQHGLWRLILALFILTGLLAGSYPAFYLTSFQPVDVLKGGGLFSKSLATQLVRNGLVVFQFTISIGLIVCTMVVFRQLHFMQTRDLGLGKDNVLIFPNVEKLNDHGRSFSVREETLRQQIASIPGITHASLSTGTLADDYAGFTDFYVPLAAGVTEPLAKDVSLTSFIVDGEFVPGLHLQLLQGRNFSRNFSDSDAVIVNEKTVQTVGWKDPLGKTIRYPGDDDKVFRVIGVVKDFNFRSLRNVVEPFALFYTTSKTGHANTDYIIASTDAQHTHAVLEQAEKKWKEVAPGIPFEFSFLDKNYEALYRSEQRMSKVFTIFTSLSILVACLGLFGLSVYTAERRIREIGIRKVLGASVQNLVQLLSRDFLRLVLLSAVIAFPLSWWAMSKWLEDFPYRTSIDAGIFLLAGLLALVIAVFTVSFQAIRAATMNPSKSLKVE